MKPETRLGNTFMVAVNRLPRTWFEKIQQVSKRGTPDRLGVINGRFVALEMKIDDDAEFEPLQLYKLEKIRAAGGLAYVVTRDNADQIYAELEDLAYGR